MKVEKNIGIELLSLVISQNTASSIFHPLLFRSLRSESPEKFDAIVRKPIAANFVLSSTQPFKYLSFVCSVIIKIIALVYLICLPELVWSFKSVF